MTTNLIRTGAIATLVLALAALVAPQLVSAAQESPRVPTNACERADVVQLPAAQARRAMVCLVNVVRQDRGLGPLTPSQELDRAATLKLAADIRCGVFSHTPCGDPFTIVFDQAGYSPRRGGRTIGENLALGTDAVSSPRSILEAWLASPAHRRVLLTPGFRELGVGIARPDSFLGREGFALWATSFGTR